jgi:RluA family pseudouridine synthase
VIELVVPEALDRIALGDFLEASLPGQQRRSLRELVSMGRVAVNTLESRGDTTLRAGDVVTIEAEEEELPVRRRETGALPKVLHEDAYAVVVDKPPGIVTVPDRFGEHEDLHEILPSIRPDADLRIVHRLDRDTSGCLLLARGLEAARFFDLAFRERRLRKTYLALVEGVVRAPFVSDRPLGPDPRRPGRIRVVDAKARGARDARTEFEVVEAFQRFTLVRAIPSTGRSHQIRVHLAHQGHAIACDPDYGARRTLLLSDLKPGYKARPGVREPPILERMFLHSESITFPLPAGGEARVAAPLPKDLELPLKKLRHFDRKARR